MAPDHQKVILGMRYGFFLVSIGSIVSSFKAPLSILLQLNSRKYHKRYESASKLGKMSVSPSHIALHAVLDEDEVRSDPSDALGNVGWGKSEDPGFKGGLTSGE